MLLVISLARLVQQNVVPLLREPEGLGTEAPTEAMTTGSNV